MKILNVAVKMFAIAIGVVAIGFAAWVIATYYEIENATPAPVAEVSMQLPMPEALPIDYQPPVTASAGLNPWVLIVAGVFVILVIFVTAWLLRGGPRVSSVPKDEYEADSLEEKARALYIKEGREYGLPMKKSWDEISEVTRDAYRHAVRSGK
jgi:hypothetical protein